MRWNKEMQMITSIDVLIVTALSEEFDAAKLTLTSTAIGEPGVSAWLSIEEGSAAPHLKGTYARTDGTSFTVALARPVRMGAITTGALTAALVERYRPYSLAMCGVCAGNPADVALGDIVVAEMAYAYTEGKRTEEGVEPDHRQSPISQEWLWAAQDLKPDGLPSFGDPTSDDRDLWLLERLYGGGDPQRHPARTRYFPKGAWTSTLKNLQEKGLICRNGVKLELTEVGRQHVEESLVYNVDPPERLPFAIKVGPMASGDVVVKDGLTWEQLKSWGVRTVVGLEMEAATIGAVARGGGVAEWIVIKGVMDHADPKKDDRYKSFAAKASAEVLLCFLDKRLSVKNKVAELEKEQAKTSSLSPSTGVTHTQNSRKIDILSGTLSEEIANSITQNAPRYRAIFYRAREAALRAYEISAIAQDLSSRVLLQVGAELDDARGRRKEFSKFKILSVPNSTPQLIAKLWDSGDEYVGEALNGMEHGLGVYKVYHTSAEFTPGIVSRYSGQMEHGKFGNSGVYTYANHADFAGEWVDGNPSFGCREYLGPGGVLESDYYFGHLVPVEGDSTFTPRWTPNGDGFAIDTQMRVITCGEFYMGKLRDASTAIKFSF
jgi:nucleoside phosphorylase